MAPSAVKDTILLDLLNLECLSMEIMCFFFLQMCCLFRLPSLPCMFCHRYPHPAFLSVSTSKAFIIISPHGRESKTGLDSGFRTARIPDSRDWNLELGFRIPINSGMADFLSCIPDSKAQDFTSKFSQILDYTSKNFLDSGIWIPLHEANHRHFFFWNPFTQTKSRQNKNSPKKWIFFW